MFCRFNMDILTNIDSTAHLSIFTLKGELDFNQLLTHIKGIHARSEHTSSCLYDLKSGGFTSFAVHPFMGIQSTNSLLWLTIKWILYLPKP